MLKIHKKHQAEQGLIDIWIYTYHNWGAKQADAYLDSIERALKSILTNPEIGEKIDDVRNGYHKLQVESHTLFYQISNTQINVIRILSNAMDYPRHI